MLFEDSFGGALFLFGTVVGAALMCLLLQQVNQLLPQQPVVVDNTPPPWAEQLIKDVAELKGARGQ